MHPESTKALGQAAECEAAGKAASGRGDRETS